MLHYQLPPDHPSVFPSSAPNKPSPIGSAVSAASRSHARFLSQSPLSSANNAPSPLFYDDDDYEDEEDEDEEDEEEDEDDYYVYEDDSVPQSQSHYSTPRQISLADNQQSAAHELPSGAKSDNTHSAMFANFLQQHNQYYQRYHASSEYWARLAAAAASEATTSAAAPALTSATAGLSNPRLASAHSAPSFAKYPSFTPTTATRRRPRALTSPALYNTPSRARSQSPTSRNSQVVVEEDEDEEEYTVPSWLRGDRPLEPWAISLLPDPLPPVLDNNNTHHHHIDLVSPARQLFAKLRKRRASEPAALVHREEDEHRRRASAVVDDDDSDTDGQLEVDDDYLGNADEDLEEELYDADGHRMMVERRAGTGRLSSRRSRQIQSEHTPTCGDALRREWQRVHWRLTVTLYRARQRARRRLGIRDPE